MTKNSASNLHDEGPSHPSPGSVDRPGGTPGGPLVYGDFDMRIATDGTWYYRGSAIQRKELVRLFASVLTRDHSGDYWLVTRAERVRVEVEDAPFVAVGLGCRYAGRDRDLTFRTNMDESVIADAAHPIRVEIVGEDLEGLIDWLTPSTRE